MADQDFRRRPGKRSPESTQSRSVGERVPRVLFVSVNPFSMTSNNGKTFASFFQGYPTDSLAQLYFHRENPGSPVCRNYFRITDEDLLRHFLRPWRVTGEPVTSKSWSVSPIPERTHRTLKQSRTARLLRQFLWTFVRLDNKALSEWLNAFAPEVVFFCGGDAAALYPKVAALAHSHGAKLVFYITDDYVLPIDSRNVSAQVMRLWTRRVFRRLTAKSDLILTIGDMMSTRYKQEFGFESLAVMNTIDVPQAPPESRTQALEPQKPLTLLYAGSLHSNRWQVLGKVTESIERLSEKGISARLRVYGPAPEEEMLRVLRPPYAEYGGLLAPDALNAAFDSADVLVHVESDDPESMAVTALSVSTKIPEYLASGRSILAIGPRGLASIEYLAAHHVAAIVEPGDVSGLDEVIETLATRPETREELARRGYELALLNHDGPRTRRLLWDRLKGMFE